MNRGLARPLMAIALTRRVFTDVHVVQGGMTAWLASGRPIEGPTPDRSEIP